MRLYDIEQLRFARGERFRLYIERLAIECGDKIAFVGQNGSGKTTLLRILAFLEHPDGCTRFEFRGRPVGAGGERPERFGFLRQQPYLFRGTVRSNLQFALKLRKIDRHTANERIEQVLDQLDLAHLAHASARALSGGEQKRLALARTLACDPTLLLLDEPDAHLDRRSQRVIEDALVNAAATLILTSHDLHFAHRVCGRVLTMQGGQITASLPENVLRGRPFDGRIETPAGLHITLPPEQDTRGDAAGQRMAVMIDPRSIVLSNQPFPSSMRNQFRGRVCSVREEGPNVWVEIDCGERLTAIISKASYQELGINLHCEVVASFKANAVEVL